MNEYRGIKGTKFQLVILTLLFGTIGLYLGKIDGNAWGMYVVGLVVIYVTGDVSSRFIAKDQNEKVISSPSNSSSINADSSAR